MQQTDNNSKTKALEDKLSSLNKKVEDLNLHFNTQQKQLLELKYLDTTVKQVQVNLDNHYV